MKYKRRLHPGAFALGANEQFYSKMEARGLKLVKRSRSFSIFEEVEPSAARYRVEVAEPSATDLNNRLPQEQIAVFEDCGWEYITSSGMLHFFRAPEGSDAPEFYQDPRQHAETLKGVRKRVVRSLVISLILLALLLAVAASHIGPDYGMAGIMTVFSTRAWLVTPYIPLFWCLLILSSLILSVADTWQVSRLYRRLKNGIPLDHSPKSSGMLSVYISRALYTVAVIFILFAAVKLFGAKAKALPEQPDGPYIVLADVGLDGARNTDPHYRSYNKLEHTKTFMSEYWKAVESVENPGYDSDAVIYQYVYKLNPNLDAMKQARGLFSTQVFARTMDEYKEVSVDGLDAAWVSEEGLEAVAVKGQMVATINYLDGRHSTERLTAVLEALAARWAEY